MWYKIEYNVYHHRAAPTQIDIYLSKPSVINQSTLIGRNQETFTLFVITSHTVSSDSIRGLPDST